jgi:hypothetical protein
MPRSLRAVARFFSNTIGWNRIGFLLSIAIITVAVFVLVHMLRNLDIDEVFAALKAVSAHRIALAAVFVAFAYYTLTFYDWFALRTIGHSEIPYTTAALSGFTSYAVGHNIGATVFTGGAVRYHIYSARGLSAVDVAKICFVAGLTFWLGNATVLGLSVVADPHAATPITQLPGWLNRIIAAGILAVLFSYIGWVWSAPRSVGKSNWTVRLPNGPSTMVQICIGLCDLGFCAMAMFMLLPTEPHVGYVTLLVVFVSATLLGFASHAPGGLGVFDAAMLVALWQFNKEDLVAGLLLFRMLYYLAPFIVALIILGIREIWLNMRRSKAPAELASVKASAPIRSEFESETGERRRS